MDKTGHALVLIIFCAGGLGMIGYMKQAMASPTVSVACSLSSIAIITILTKEGNPKPMWSLWHIIVTDGF